MIPRHVVITLRMILIFGLIWPMIGCQTSPSTRSWPALLDPSILRDVETISADDLLPPNGQSTHFLYTLGPHHGQRVLYELAPQADHWLATVAERSSGRIFRDDVGLTMDREIDFKEQVKVVYDPPLLLLPAQLSMNQPIVTTCRMQVRNLQNGEIKTEGTCETQIELLGQAEIETPAGVMEAHLVRTRRKLALSLAQVRVQIIEAYVEGQGLVARRIDRKTKALGLLTTQREDEMRLEK